MKRYKKGEGTPAWTASDMLSLQQESLGVLDGFLSGNGSCIIQGCNVTDRGNGIYDISEGLAAFRGADVAGEEKTLVVPFDGVKGVTLPLYLNVTADTSTRLYGDGIPYPVTVQYKAVPGEAKAGSIEIADMQPVRFRDLFPDGDLGFVTALDKRSWNSAYDDVKATADEKLAYHTRYNPAFDYFVESAPQWTAIPADASAVYVAKGDYDLTSLERLEIPESVSHLKMEEGTILKLKASGSLEGTIISHGKCLWEGGRIEVAIAEGSGPAAVFSPSDGARYHDMQIAVECARTAARVSVFEDTEANGAGTEITVDGCEIELSVSAANAATYAVYHDFAAAPAGKSVWKIRRSRINKSSPEKGGFLYFASSAGHDSDLYMSDCRLFAGNGEILTADMNRIAVRDIEIEVEKKGSGRVWFVLNGTKTLSCIDNVKCVNDSGTAGELIFEAEAQNAAAGQSVKNLSVTGASISGSWGYPSMKGLYNVRDCNVFGYSGCYSGNTAETPYLAGLSFEGGWNRSRVKDFLVVYPLGEKPLDIPISALGYGDGIWMMGFENSEPIHWSADGFDWHPIRDTVPQYHVTQLDYGNGYWMGSVMGTVDGILAGKIDREEYAEELLSISYRGLSGESPGCNFLNGYYFYYRQYRYAHEIHMFASNDMELPTTEWRRWSIGGNGGWVPLDGAYGEGIYFIMGERGQGYLFSENLEETYSIHSIADTASSIAFGNGMFVMTGELWQYDTEWKEVKGNIGITTPHIIKNYDGFTYPGSYWNISTALEGEYITKICFGGDVFLVGTERGRIAYSHDAVEWTEIPTCLEGGYITAIKYGDGMFMVANAIGQLACIFTYLPAVESPFLTMENGEILRTQGTGFKLVNMKEEE